MYNDPLRSVVVSVSAVTVLCLRFSYFAVFGKFLGVLAWDNRLLSCQTTTLEVGGLPTQSECDSTKQLWNGVFTNGNLQILYSKPLQKWLTQTVTRWWRWYNLLFLFWALLVKYFVCLSVQACTIQIQYNNVGGRKPLDYNWFPN